MQSINNIIIIDSWNSRADSNRVYPYTHTHTHTHTQVCNTPNSLPFLHMLQSLLLLDRDTTHSSLVWEAIEEFTQKVVLMEQPDTSAGKAREVSIVKLRTALQKEQNRSSKSSRTENATSLNVQGLNVPLT